MKQLVLTTTTLPHQYPAAGECTARFQLVLRAICAAVMCALSTGNVVQAK
jgi:hypothetical protein